MNKTKLAALILAGLALLSTAKADIVLTFEDFKDGELVLEGYNGGTGSMGTSSTNAGVSFSNNATIIAGWSYPGLPNAGLMYYDTGSGVTLNVAGGFGSEIAINYAAYATNGQIAVYSGLNGTGTLLGSLSLASTYSADGSTYNFIHISSLSFAGVANSLVLSGDANYIGFDNITLGTAATPVPEPSTYGLMGAGALAGLGFLRRHRRNKQAA